MTFLVDSLLIEEEMRNREVELKLKLEQVLAYKVRKPNCYSVMLKEFSTAHS